MNAGRDDRRDSVEHPHDLPWYVAGSLDRDRMADVKRHLEICSECREEIRALASMRGTFLRQGRTDHVSPEDLVAYHAKSATSRTRPREEVERHLSSCDDCREELDLLGRADPATGEPTRVTASNATTVPALPAVRVRPSATRRRLALALAAALAVGLGIEIQRQAQRPPRATEALEAARAITLQPPQRGDEAEPVLRGDGAWSITVILPFGASPGEYRLRLQNRQGPSPQDLTVAARAEPAGTLTVLLRALPPPGSYRLVLEPPESPAGRRFEYPLRVEGDSAGRTVP